MGNWLSCFGGVGRIVHPPTPWEHDEAITRAQLNNMRELFWSQPPNDAPPEIWNALRRACEAVIADGLHGSVRAQRIIDRAGLERFFGDLRTCYDKRRGMEYQLPRYVQSDPINLIR